MDSSRGMISISDSCWIGLKGASQQETSINKYFLAVILYCNLHKKTFHSTRAVLAVLFLLPFQRWPWSVILTPGLSPRKPGSAGVPAGWGRGMPRVTGPSDCS